MSPDRKYYHITESINCPFYQPGDAMSLTAKSLAGPAGKELCLVLVRDLMNLLIRSQGEQERGEQRDPGATHNCSGCSGLIKFVESGADEQPRDTRGHHVPRLLKVMENLNGRSVDCPFLEALHADRIGTMLERFDQVSVPAGTTLVQQGKPSLNLYLILAGEFALERSQETVTVLGPGEVFGEMSCFGAVRTLWSVRATEDSIVVDLTAQELGHLLSSSATVLIYIAKLLAVRLEMLNSVKLIDTEASMSGSLDDITPAELFQVFHLHQKSGVLHLHLGHGNGAVSFREGQMVKATYNDTSGELAVYSILAETTGTYRFIPGLPAAVRNAPVIGDFMMLLMEGIRLGDENGQQ